jgi:hypothetical protein
LTCFSQFVWHVIIASLPVRHLVRCTKGGDAGKSLVKISCKMPTTRRMPRGMPPRARTACFGAADNNRLEFLGNLGSFLQPGQVCGVPWLAPVMLALCDLDDGARRRIRSLLSILTASSDHGNGNIVATLPGSHHSQKPLPVCARSPRRVAPESNAISPERPD